MKRYILIIFLCLLAINQYQKIIQAKEHETENINTLSDTVTYYINKLNTQTASVKTLKLDKLQLENTLLKRDKEFAALASEFRQINHITKYNSTTIIDTIKVKFKDSIPFVLERNGRVSNAWYKFRYTSTQKGFDIDSLTFPTQTTVLTGVKRKWFLGAETLSTDITNTNPYIKVAEIKSAEIALTQPWYKKWYIWMAVGTIGGFFTAK